MIRKIKFNTLKNNLVLKEYFKKPNFISNNHLLILKKLLEENKNKEFINKISKISKSKKLNTDNIFHIYFYLYNNCEKSNKFLEKYIYSKLNYKMYLLFDNIIDKDIYAYLKHNYKQFKDRKNKEILLKINKDIKKLDDLINKMYKFNKNTINKDIHNIILLSKKLKSKKIKEIVNSILKDIYSEFDGLNISLKDKINYKKEFI